MTTQSTKRGDYIHNTVAPLSVKKNTALRKLEEYPSEHTLRIYREVKEDYDASVVVLNAMPLI